MINIAALRLAMRNRALALRQSLGFLAKAPAVRCFPSLLSVALWVSLASGLSPNNRRLDVRLSVLGVFRASDPALALSAESPATPIAHLDAGVLGCELVPVLAMGLGPMDNREVTRRPPLGVAVDDVLGLRSQEEMFWVDAASVVAAVKHARSVESGTFGDRAVGQLPRNAVGDDHSTPDTELTVAAGVRAGSPIPAPIRLRDLRPEALSTDFVHGVKVTECSSSRYCDRRIL